MKEFSFARVVHYCMDDHQEFGYLDIIRRLQRRGVAPYPQRYNATQGTRNDLHPVGRVVMDFEIDGLVVSTAPYFDAPRFKKVTMKPNPHFRLSYYDVGTNRLPDHEGADRVAIEVTDIADPDRWIAEWWFSDPHSLTPIRTLRLMEIAYQRGRNDG